MNTRSVLCERVSGVLVVTPVSPRLFADAGIEVGEQASAQLMVHPGPLVLDLQNVESIDSVFLSVLVELAKRGGPVVVAGASQHIRQTLQVTGVDRIVRVSPRVLDAVQLVCGADDPLAWTKAR